MTVLYGKNRYPKKIIDSASPTRSHILNSSMPENDKNDHSALPAATSCWAIRPYPDLIDPSKIEADGGKWIRLEDGRIVEYFLSGSSSPDATVLVDCPGGNCTGHMFSAFPSWNRVAESLNYRVISVSYPGFGYSSIHPGRSIKDWPITDLLPILRKENVEEFAVTGISFGSCHALATAWNFAQKREDDKNSGITCIGLGLRVPYLGSESCEELNLKNHITVGYTTASANTTLLGTIAARVFTMFASKPGDAFKSPGPMMRAFVNFLNPGALDKLEHLLVEHSDLMNTCKRDMDRCVVHTDQGILYNYATDTLVDHGFIVTEIRSDLPVYLWYAEDDEDCPPSHGMWIANKNTDDSNHFTNVSSRAFNNYGHIGTAFLDHEEFLKAFHDHIKQ